jgi:hypothetical protein
MRIAFLALAAACGTEPPTAMTTETIFPIAVGNRWEYRLQDTDGEIGTKIQTVTSTTEGGFVFKTVRGDRETYSVQQVDAEGRLVRISEHSTFLGEVVEKMTFTPHDIRVDVDSIELGGTYSQTYLEDHDPSDGIVDVEKTQTFTVDAVDELITVPAGSFRTVRIRRNTVNGVIKIYWYAIGVGKVKEAGGQLEELVSSAIVAPSG